MTRDVKDLVLFACPGLPEARVVKLYEDALPTPAELRWIGPAGRSAVFSQVGQNCRGADGLVLPGLLARYAPGPWRSVSLISYSAGYGLARELLRRPEDRMALAGYVAIDSVHAGLVGGQPSIVQLEPFGVYAAMAKQCECLFALGHTDVATPQTGPDAFASTTQCAAWLVETVPAGGAWIVRAYDLADDAHQKAEHGRALSVWGAPFVAETLGAWLAAWGAYAACAEAEEPCPDTVPSGDMPWLDPALPRGERCVLWSLAEKADGIVEVPPGSNTSQRIRFYLAPCERAGRRLGLAAAPWCAASACAAELATRLPGEKAAHPYRCSGLEMQADAEARDTWRAKGCGYAPRRGDLAIYRRRSAADPEGKWQRHVVRVETAPESDGVWRSLGGNEGGTWALASRGVADGDLLGWVEYT